MALQIVTNCKFLLLFLQLYIYSYMHACDLFYRWNWDEIRCDMLVIRVIMEGAATVALTATMPLAYLEFFSNYALICFSGDRYYGYDSPESQLGHDRDAVLIAFYVCILVLKMYEKMVKTPQKAKDRLKLLF